MTEETRDWQWWTLGILKEGLAHLALAVGIWLALHFMIYLQVDQASVGTALYFIGREVRDFEIEFIPKEWNFLRPAPRASLEQLRHSISGWLPVVLACAIAYFVL